MSNITFSLNGNYYTDPQVYEKECVGVLAKTWQFGCHSADIPLPGCFQTFEIAGESLLAVRDKDQSVKVFYNVCQHRAHRLVTGAGRRPTLVCPYHGWRYHLDGTFQDGPNVSAVQDFDRGSICLTRVRSE